MLDKAAGKLVQQAQQASAGLGLRPQQQLERQWVDERFADLREMVLGSASAATATTGKTPASGVGLIAAGAVLNELYTALVAADAALASGVAPATRIEAAARLRLEAGKMPVPLRAVLLDLSEAGTDTLGQAASQILRTQAQSQVDRLNTLMAATVTEPCKRMLLGRYPFAASQQDVSIDDFSAFFAEGGLADDFFRKNLLPLVDTSVRPWRYKSAAAVASGSGDAFALGVASPSVDGPTLMSELLRMLARNGPNPDAFAQVAQVRELFFRDPGAKRMGWRGEYRIRSLDAAITEWVIDFDGQVQRYAHGAIQTVALQWPGPRGGSTAEMLFIPRQRTDSTSLTARGPWAAELQYLPRQRAENTSLIARGPWAWMRLIERGQLSASSQSGRYQLEFQIEGRRAVMEIASQGPNPFQSNVLRNFSCPGSFGG